MDTKWCPFVSILAEMVSALMSIRVHPGCQQTRNNVQLESVFGSLLTDGGQESVYRILAAHVRGVNDCESATVCSADYRTLSVERYFLPLGSVGMMVTAVCLSGYPSWSEGLSAAPRAIERFLVRVKPHAKRR
jgi:hypothetical protein